MTEVEFDDPTENVNLIFDSYTVTIFKDIMLFDIIICQTLDEVYRIKKSLEDANKLLYTHQNLTKPDEHNFITKRFYKQLERLW